MILNLICTLYSNMITKTIIKMNLTEPNSIHQETYKKLQRINQIRMI